MSNNLTEDFESKYTNANLAGDAAQYDRSLFLNFVQQLEDIDNGSISRIAVAIIAAMLYGQRRGDIVPRLFHDIAERKSDEERKALFPLIKQALNFTWVFVGLPHSMPACFGLVNEAKHFEIQVKSDIDRPLLNEKDWLGQGQATNREIYRAVGNPEVGHMIAEYFPEISYIANAAVFGFLIGGSAHIQPLPLSEIIIAGAIAAMGATRQISAWNGTVLSGGIDVPLAEEAKANLKNAKEP